MGGEMTGNFDRAGGWRLLLLVVAAVVVLALAAVFGLAELALLRLAWLWTAAERVVGMATGLAVFLVLDRHLLPWFELRDWAMRRPDDSNLPLEIRMASPEVRAAMVLGWWLALAAFVLAGAVAA